MLCEGTAAVFMHFAWLIFGLLPAVLLAVLLMASATVVLDHDVLGRDADGWPVLYKTPILREAVDAIHVLTMCVLPVLVAIGFLKLGMKHGARPLWIVLGGVLACPFGSVWLIEAIWTDVKGASGLLIGIEETGVIAARLVASLTVYAIAAVPHFRS
jgi:hypothetical protein